YPNGVFKSVDGSANWTDASAGLGSTDIRGLAIDPVTSTTVYAGTNGGGVFKSVDGAGSWTTFNNGLSASEILSLATALKGSSLHVGSWGSSVFDHYGVPVTSFYTLAPCRVVDTRGAPGPMGGPALVANGERTFVIAGQCGIPATARVVAFNFTVTEPTALG